MEKFYINYKSLPFLKTSKTAAFSNRLNWRCEILLTRNQDAIKDKKILDLASHDGRFSYACLKLGASHVTGIEDRSHLVKNARENLINLGCEQKNFTFFQDDVFNYLPKVKSGEFDTILCFGFFYHTIRQVELLKEIKRIQPRYFILDTMIEKDLIEKDLSKRNILFRPIALIPTIKLKHFVKIDSTTIKKLKNVVSTTKENKACLVFKDEDHTIEGHTIDRIDLIAWPTQSFIELFFKKQGFNFKQLYWDKQEINNWDYITDYKNGKRISYIAQLY